MKQFSIYDNICKKELIIEIGMNAQENFDLIDKSSRTDIWIHLRDYPSPHVVLHNKGKKIDIETIRYCGELCKEFSKYNDKEEYIIFTQIKDLQKQEIVGSVLCYNEIELLI